MSDKYAALKSRIEKSLEDFTNGRASMHVPALDTDVDLVLYDCLDLLAEREADKARIAQLEAERDALREGEMGDAKHSNTRAAADIYFQLVEECNIQAGGSLVEYVDDLRDRIAELESRKAKLPSLNPQMFNDDVMFGYRKAQKEAVEFCAAAGITLETGE